MIELKKAREEETEEMSMYRKWCLFFLEGHKEGSRVVEELRKEEVFRMAIDRLKEMQEDQRMKDMAFARMKREMDEAQIREEGHASGVNQRNQEIVNNMLKEGLDISLIQKLTDLTLHEIELLKEK